MSADLFCLTDLRACKLKMTKRKFTSDEIEDLLNKSDSEFDADDSVTDRDSLPGNALGDKSFSDNEILESNDQILSATF